MGDDAEAVMAVRTGNEPVTARSALRLRFWLSLWGLVWSGAGAAAFSLAARPGWAAACATVTLLAAVDLAVVLHRIHQGPHYQPGRDIPPYDPPAH